MRLGFGLAKACVKDAKKVIEKMGMVRSCADLGRVWMMSVGAGMTSGSVIDKHRVVGSFAQPPDQRATSHILPRTDNKSPPDWSGIYHEP